MHCLKKLNVLKIKNIQKITIYNLTGMLRKLESGQKWELK